MLAPARAKARSRDDSPPARGKASPGAAGVVHGVAGETEVRIYKRGGVWWVQHRGRRVSTGCTDRQAADLWAREHERACADPGYRAAREATVRGALDALIVDLVRRERSAATILIVRQKAGHLLRLLDGPLARIDAQAVDAYVAQREAETAAPLTITKELSALRQALRLAIRRGDYHRPLDAVMPVAYSPRYVPRSRWLPPAELEALLAELPAWRAAHVAFVVATGARRSEATRALRTDVGPATVHLRGSKTASSLRTVPRLPMFAPLLTRAMADAPGPRGGHLFAAWGNARRDMTAACERAGIAPCTWNDLRRTHASWLRSAGVAPHDIATLLGHTTSRMVEMVYGRQDPADLGRRLQTATVPLVYRSPGREGVSGAGGAPGAAKNTGNLSRLGDLNPRPTVYETVPRIRKIRQG